MVQTEKYIYFSPKEILLGATPVFHGVPAGMVSN